MCVCGGGGGVVGVSGDVFILFYIYILSESLPNREMSRMFPFCFAFCIFSSERYQ